MSAPTVASIITALLANGKGLLAADRRKPFLHRRAKYNSLAVRDEYFKENEKAGLGSLSK